jgi:hypothetical protein
MGWAAEFVFEGVVAIMPPRLDVDSHFSFSEEFDSVQQWATVQRMPCALRNAW